MAYLKSSSKFLIFFVLFSHFAVGCGFNGRIRDLVTSWETCTSLHIRSPKAAQDTLRQLLKEELFGQHLVLEGLLFQIYSHLSKENPDSPLLISLHGPTGCGKSLTASCVAKALYSKGDRSKHVKIFTASYHFPDPDPKLLKHYQSIIWGNITEMVRNCPNSLFIFDEVDKMPNGLLDVLVGLINHAGSHIDGTSYKQAIYLFLGNAGQEEIENITLTNRKTQDKQRWDLDLMMFQDVLSNAAFNEKGGWYKTSMVEKLHVDWFIPYLPLERIHVKECFKRLAREYPNIPFEEHHYERMADHFSYWPDKQKYFSRTGCKKAENIFLFEMNRLRNIHERREL